MLARRECGNASAGSSGEAVPSPTSVCLKAGAAAAFKLESLWLLFALLSLSSVEQTRKALAGSGPPHIGRPLGPRWRCPRS